MSLNNPTPGPNSAVEYMVSGIPWVSTFTTTGLTIINFPAVTRNIAVKNVATGNNVLINVGFTQNGVMGNNYFALNPAESFDSDVRCTALYIYGGSTYTCSVIAGLTGIPMTMFPTLTGSLPGGFAAGVG